MVGQGDVGVEQQEPAAERPGDDRREETRARDQREAAVAKCVDRRRPWRRALAAQHVHVVARAVVEDHRQVPAGAVQVRLDNLQGETRGDCGVERIAATLEHRHPGGGREPVRRRDHAERPAQLRSRRELHDGDPRGAANGAPWFKPA